MNILFKIIVLLLVFTNNFFSCFGQIKPSPEKDEIALTVYIHGLNSKEDILEVHSLFKDKKWLRFIQVECFPQKHTELIIKNSVTPEMINDVLKPHGFFIINQSFNDEIDIENSLFESRKMNSYKPFRKIDL